MAAKKVKWLSFWIIPKVKQPHSNGFGYGHDVSAYFVDRHVALIDRHEFDVSRIVDGMPDELAIIGLFEPTAERVVPT